MSHTGIIYLAFPLEVNIKNIRRVPDVRRFGTGRYDSYSSLWLCLLCFIKNQIRTSNLNGPTSSTYLGSLFLISNGVASV